MRRPTPRFNMPHVRRGDVLGSALAVVLVALFLVFLAWHGRFIGSHLAEGDPSCVFGPKGTTCALTSSWPEQARR